MAHITENPTMVVVPSAKSSEAWTPSDLMLFNIKVVPEGSDTFFGKSLSDVPIPYNVTLSPRIWNSLKRHPRPQSKHKFLFFIYMEKADRIPLDPDCDNRFVNTVDFAHFLLGQLLEYDGRDGRVLHTRNELPFEMCGAEVIAHADIGLTERRWDEDVYQDYLLV